MSMPDIILPSAVIGYTSPYPVVGVVNENQNASPVFFIVDPGVSLSTAYMPKDPKFMVTEEIIRK